MKRQKENYGWIIPIIISLILGICIIGEAARLSKPQDYWPWGDIDISYVRVVNGELFIPPQAYYYNVSIGRWEVHVWFNENHTVFVLPRRYS